MSKQDLKQTIRKLSKVYNDDKNFPWRNSPVMSGEEKFDELLKLIRLDFRILENEATIQKLKEGE